MDHSYNVNVNWLNTRIGSISSPELYTSIEVVTPPPFDGGIPGKWSPEHFLVAAVTGCLMTTFLAIAENSKFAFKNFTCDACGKLGSVEGKLQVTEITLKPVLKIENEKDRERAERIIRKSEEACLISKSIKSKINLEITVTV
jgi:peroxiredoxin-like protein